MQGQPLRFAPEEVGTLIVAQLKAAAEAYVGREVGNAVLAVPVGFDASQINATRRAAEDAGLEHSPHAPSRLRTDVARRTQPLLPVCAGFTVLRTIHEPTAAAMAYGLHTRANVYTVMVYDIGGGTLDVSLLNLNNGVEA